MLTKFCVWRIIVMIKLIDLSWVNYMYNKRTSSQLLTSAQTGSCHNSVKYSEPVYPLPLPLVHVRVCTPYVCATVHRMIPIAQSSCMRYQGFCNACLWVCVCVCVWWTLFPRKYLWTLSCVHFVGTASDYAVVWYTYSYLHLHVVVLMDTWVWICYMSS